MRTLPPHLENLHVPLAIFDLDNTLLAGDSDYLWGRFLAERGVVDGDAYERENKRFYEEYKAGDLDIMEFLAFSLKPLAENDPQQLEALRAEFVETVIRPIVPTASRTLLEHHRRQGDELLIITATNRFVTEPIAELLDVPWLIATDPERKGERFTGRVAGTPCFRKGKVERLTTWLRETGHHLAGSHFYSDSHNDFPLLEMVETPVAVDPDDTLRDHAEMKGWPILSLRGERIAVLQGRWPTVGT